MAEVTPLAEAQQPQFATENCGGRRTWRILQTQLLPPKNVGLLDCVKALKRLGVFPSEPHLFGDLIPLDPLGRESPVSMILPLGFMDCKSHLPGPLRGVQQQLLRGSMGVY